MKREKFYFLIFSIFLALGGQAPANELDYEGGMAIEDILKLRDPFKKPKTLTRAGVKVSILESFPVEDFVMVGMLTGPQAIRAMLKAPNGKTYFVQLNDRVGTRQGVVRSIEENAVTVAERIMNVLGKEEVVLSEIRFEGNPVDNATGSGGS